MRLFLPFFVATSLRSLVPFQAEGAAFVSRLDNHRDPFTFESRHHSTNRFLMVQQEICEENGITVAISDSNYKPGAIDVLSQESTHVIFTAAQIFSDEAWTSVVYKDESGETVCKQKSQAKLGYKRSFKAQCEDNGVATIDVYVQSSGWSTSNRANPSPALCPTWPTSSDSSMNNVELFSYKVACGSCDRCTPPPDIEVPFDPEDEVCEGEGVNVLYRDDETYKAGAISILHQSPSEVIFTLSQVYSQSRDGSLVSVVYQDTESQDWTCDNSEYPLAYMAKRSFKASCDVATGVATVDVYVHNPEWTANMVNPLYSDRPGECSSWTTSDSPSGVALISYELSCGICADCVIPPPTPFCPEENKLVSTIGKTMFPEWPLVITAQNDFSVSFYVEQTWTEKATVFTQFDHEALGTSQCFQSTEVEKNSRQEFTAICLPTSKVAMIHIWVVDEAFSPTADNAQVPECCIIDNAPEYPTVQYTFLISCTSLCPETSERKLLRGSAHKFI